MKEKSPAYQWYVRQWLASPTRLRLSKAARSAYRDLLDYLWDSGDCTLPNDETELRRLADCTPIEWKKFGADILKNFIECGEGRITNARMMAQWKERKSYINKSIKAGKEGAEKRWGAHREAIATPMRFDSSASASASASVSVNQESKPRPQNQRPVLQTSVQELAKAKTLTPPRRYDAIGLLVNGAVGIYMKAKEAGKSIHSADCKEDLKDYASRHNLPCDGDAICKALDIAEQRVKAVAS